MLTISSSGFIFAKVPHSSVAWTASTRISLPFCSRYTSCVRGTSTLSGLYGQASPPQTYSAVSPFSAITFPSIARISSCFSVLELRI